MENLDLENIEKQIFIKKVKDGLAQIKTKETLTHQQVQQKVREWALLKPNNRR